MLLIPLFAGIAVSAWMLPVEKIVRTQKSPRGSLKAILTHPAVIAFFVMNFLLQVAHGSYYTFFSIHLQLYDYGKLAIGLLWSLGVIAEIVLFMMMHRLSARFSVRHIVLAALLLTLLRWLLIAEMVSVLPVLIFAQLLHAASYGALHAVSVQYIQGFFGRHHHGQGQALYSGLTFGAGGALGAWGAGFLVDGIDTSAAFLASAAVTALAFAAAWRGLQPPPELERTRGQI
jgi:PPP family 3-phenylpropionic acid transporter